MSDVRSSGGVVEEQGQSERVKSYRELVGWQRAMELVEGVYKAGQQWPKEETFGLINQIRRAVVSVPANIAEGQGRRSPNEFVRFLRHRQWITFRGGDPSPHRSTFAVC